MAPTNRTEFKEYCLRKLGKPVLQINADDTQIEDRIDEALYKFYERNYYGVEEVYILHDITESDKAQGFIQLDNDIMGVVNVFRPRYIAGVHTAQADFYLQELYALIHPNSVGGGMAYFYMHASHMSLLNRFFNPDKSYNYNPITNKLIIAGGLTDSDNRWGGVIIRAWRKVHGEADSSNPSNTVIYEIWKNKWLQDYGTALIKKQWAQNMSKFNQVQLVGGVSLNGEQMMQDAKEEIEKLEEQLQLEYEEPPGFFIG